MVPQFTDEVLLSITRGRISSFFRLLKSVCMVFIVLLSVIPWFTVIRATMCRRYGAWVARNPTIVLCSSLAVVLILCVGLLRFKVETRPEKVHICFLFFLNYVIVKKERVNSRDRSPSRF